MSKIILAIIIIVLISAGWWYFSHSPTTSQTYSNTTASAVGSTPKPEAAISATASSDAALTSDMAGMDAQLKALDNDSAQADQSMSQPQ